MMSKNMKKMINTFLCRIVNCKLAPNTFEVEGWSCDISNKDYVEVMV